jgi:hypothetical protein
MRRPSVQVAQIRPCSKVQVVLMLISINMGTTPSPYCCVTTAGVQRGRCYVQLLALLIYQRFPFCY